MPHPHFTRPAKPNGNLVLQERDIQILDLVYTYRFIDTFTLGLLLHHQGSAWALQGRLQKLYDHHYLDRPHRQLALKVIGEERFLIYALGREGAKVLATKYGEPLEKLRWTQKNNEVGDVHLKHTLGVARLRAALRLAIPDDAPSEGSEDYTRPYLLPWKQGEDIKARVMLPGRRDEDEAFILTPDGFFGLQKPKAPPNRSWFFLEYERSSNLKRFLRAKGMAYRALWKEKLQEKLFGIRGFRVLVIAQTERKKDMLRQRIRKWLATVTDHPSAMWLFTSEERYQLHQPESILSPIWQAAGEDQLVSLLE